MIKVRLEFCKADNVRWLSHLEISRAWHRIINRAGLPIAYSEGFSPHPKIALSAALPVGIGSEAEYADLVLCDEIPAEELFQRLNDAAPAGIKISRVGEVPPGTPSLGASIKFADYRLSFAGPAGPVDDIVRLPIESKLNAAITAEAESRGVQRDAIVVDRVAQWVIVENGLVDPMRMLEMRKVDE